jgi:hypothetical protein
MTNALDNKLGSGAVLVDSDKEPKTLITLSAMQAYPHLSPYAEAILDFQAVW